MKSRLGRGLLVKGTGPKVSLNLRTVCVRACIQRAEPVPPRVGPDRRLYCLFMMPVVLGRQVEARWKEELCAFLS
jgi:hypothetical protein